MAPTCLYALPATSGHAPDETVDGVLGDLLPDLDQGISELLDSLWCYLARCTDTYPRGWIQVCGIPNCPRGISSRSTNSSQGTVG